MDAGQIERGVDPDRGITSETQAPLRRQQDDFPGRDGRDGDAVRASHLFDAGTSNASKAGVAVDHPDQYVRINDNHRAAFQSDGSAADAKGLS